MAFHEKSAWIMSLGLLIGGVLYFAMVAGISNKLGQLAPPLLVSVIMYTVILIAIAVIGHVLIAMFSPKEANASLDERERQIQYRAGHWSGYALGLGVIASLGVYLFTQHGDLLFYCIFASLMLSQLMEYVAQIVLYRVRF